MERSAAPNATMTKFGFPETVVADYDAWTVQLRPKQVTLGSLVLVCKSPAKSFHAIGADAFTELEQITSDIERVLAELFAYERINYLMLMMVDPDVHFHVIPRYSRSRSFAGIDFPDAGWPGPPDLKSGIDADARLRSELVSALQEAWATG